MKVTFKPLQDPAPIRPADMPEGVAFEYEYGGSLNIGIVYNKQLWTVSPSGKPERQVCTLDTQHAKTATVICRRDGQPLPSAGGKPVPLDTLEPFPVWYRASHVDGWMQHNGRGGYLFTKDGTGCDGNIEGSANKSVYPTPHVMEVQP